MRSRHILMWITDIGMLTYWSVTALMALSIVSIPGEWLFSDYNDPRVVAWNWSFMPLDVIFSILGIWSLRLERRGDPRWRPVAISSLSLTVCAGLMAISYWVLVGDFDPTWWLVNLFLLIWPLPYLFTLFRLDLTDKTHPTSTQ